MTLLITYVTHATSTDNEAGVALIDAVSAERWWQPEWHYLYRSGL